MTRPISSFRRPAGIDWRESHARLRMRDRGATASQAEELIRIGSDALALAVRAFRQAATGNRAAGDRQQEMLKDLSSVLIQLADGGAQGWEGERPAPSAALSAPPPSRQCLPLPRAAVEQAMIDHVGRTLELGKGASHLLLCLLKEPGVFHELPELSRLLSLRSANHTVLRVYACRLRRALERHGMTGAIVTGACSYMLRPDYVPAVRALLE